MPRIAEKKEQNQNLEEWISDFTEKVLLDLHFDRVRRKVEDPVLPKKLAAFQMEMNKVLPIVLEMEGIHEFLDELFWCMQKAQREFIERKQYEYWKTLPLE